MPRQFLRGIRARVHIAKRTREKKKALKRLIGIQAFQQQNRDSELRWLLELKKLKKKRGGGLHKQAEVQQWFRNTQEKLMDTNRQIDRIEAQIRRLKALKK